MRRVRLSVLVFGAVVAGGLGSSAIAQEPQHFTPKGKLPSKYTIEAQQQQRKILPLADKQDFAQDQHRPPRHAKR
jgi:linear primary-alkylsulfatase